MNCYMCDDHGHAVAAVAICQNCGIAVCRAHLDGDLLASRVQGVTRRGCTHDPILGARRRQRTHAEATSSPN